MRLRTQQFAELVRQALDSLPEQFRRHLANVGVEIQPAPTPEQLEQLGGGDASELLGAYFGVPLTEKSVSDTFEWPEQIIIFQRNVERACRSRQEIVREVRTTVLHEIAHHFGMTDEDLEALGYD